jgi:hypothetical protein
MEQVSTPEIKVESPDDNTTPIIQSPTDQYNPGDVKQKPQIPGEGQLGFYYSYYAHTF